MVQNYGFFKSYYQVGILLPSFSEDNIRKKNLAISVYLDDYNITTYFCCDKYNILFFLKRKGLNSQLPNEKVRVWPSGLDPDFWILKRQLFSTLSHWDSLKKYSTFIGRKALSSALRSASLAPNLQTQTNDTNPDSSSLESSFSQNYLFEFPKHTTWGDLNLSCPWLSTIFLPTKSVVFQGRVLVYIFSSLLPSVMFSVMYSSQVNWLSPELPG